MTWSKLATPESPPASLSRSRNLMYAPDLHAYLLDLQRMGNAGNELWAFRRRERPAVVLRPPSRLVIAVSTPSATLRWPRAIGASKYRVLRSLTRGGLDASWSTLPSAPIESTWYSAPSGRRQPLKKSLATTCTGGRRRSPPSAWARRRRTETTTPTTDASLRPE